MTAWADYIQRKRTERPQESEQILIEESYGQYWTVHQKELSHYFRYLYNIFRFINDNEYVDRKLYSRIARAQLSDQELLVLFYNCLYKFGVEKFKPIVEEFEIFDNLPQHLLLNPNHTDFYDLREFGSS